MAESLKFNCYLIECLRNSSHIRMKRSCLCISEHICRHRDVPFISIKPRTKHSLWNQFILWVVGDAFWIHLFSFHFIHWTGQRSFWFMIHNTISSIRTISITFEQERKPVSFDSIESSQVWWIQNSWTLIFSAHYDYIHKWNSALILICLLWSKQSLIAGKLIEASLSLELSCLKKNDVFVSLK